MPLSWNPDDYSDNLIVKKFVQELIKLVQEYSSYVFLRKDNKNQPGLMIKDRKSEKALMEYRPIENRLFARPHNYENLDVNTKLVNDYHAAIKNIGPSITESNMAIFLDYLRKIIIQLNKLNTIDKSNVFNKMSLDENEEDYLPVRADFENACRKCSQFLWETSGIPIDRIFEIMEKDLLRKDFKLHKDWQIITEKNIAFWAKTHDE